MTAPEGQLRASDAERERIIDVLRRHTADGRLTLEEFEERVGEALAATTRDDLGPVLRDLPPLPAAAPVEARATARRRIRWPSLDGGRALLGAVAVVVVVTLLATGGWGMWWIVFPLMGVFGGCGRGAASCAGGRSQHGDDSRHGGRVADADRRGGRVVDDDREIIRV
jgi:hypothetical protein